MRYLLALVLMATTNAASAATFERIEFGSNLTPKVVSDSGVEVTVQAVAEDEYSEKALAAIRYPGFPLMMLELESTPSGYARGIGIGKLNANDQAPSVLLQSFSGGAHCCTTIVAAVPDAGRFRKVELGTWDGEGLSAFPEDIDGDGIADFVMNDNAFNYAFSSYAGSWAPPQIKNIYRGQVVDVSNQSGFGALFEAFAKQTKEACADLSNSDRNGACAAYVAASARLGRADAALKFADMLSYKGADAVLPEYCRVATVNGACPDGQTAAFTSFYSAIRWFLKKQGYLE